MQQLVKGGTLQIPEDIHTLNAPDTFSEDECIDQVRYVQEGGTPLNHKIHPMPPPQSVRQGQCVHSHFSINVQLFREHTRFG